MFADLLMLRPAPITGARLVSFEPDDALSREHQRLKKLKDLLVRDIHARRMANGREANAIAARKVKRTQTRIAGCLERIAKLEAGEC